MWERIKRSSTTLHCKTKKMCKKAVSVESGTLEAVPDQCESRKMCEKQN